MEIDQMAKKGILIDENSPSKGDQVNKELAEEATWLIGSANQDLRSKAAPSHESDNQLKEDANELQRQESADKAQKELQAELDQNTPKSKPEIQGQDNDYYNGMSQ